MSGSLLTGLKKVGKNLNLGGDYMTPIGQAVFGFYSFISIAALMVLNIKKIAKEESIGWELVALIPVLIFIANVI